MPRQRRLSLSSSAESMVERNFAEAISSAFDTALSADERVVLLGARDSIADRLRQRYGPGRLIDTQAVTGGIVAVAFGMAVAGMRPVADIRLNGPSCLSYDGMVDRVSRIRYVSSHRFTAPMVIRIRFGGNSEGVGGHLETIESTLAHVPGLKVVVPSTPRDAQGLLLASIEDPDPVVFLEPIRLYALGEEEIPHGSQRIEIGPVRRELEGGDITLISWGAMMPETRQAANRLSEEGLSVEVIDVRTLSPLDRDGIASSVDKTGRAVVIHEAPLNAGFGSEIAATIQARCVYSLLAPVQRVAGWDTAFPLKKGEEIYRPSADRILAAVARTLG